MAIKSRKKLILAALENVYGVQPGAMAPTNAILVKNISHSPLEAEKVGRDLQKAFFGNSEELMTAMRVKLGYETELVGSGVVGQLPGFDCLLRACGFEPTLIKKDVTISHENGVATVVLADHGRAVGDKIVFEGATDDAYNGIKTVTGIAVGSFTFDIAGNPVSPAAGAPKVVTGVKYTPVTDDIKSVTQHVNIDGVNHALRGCRGNLEINIAVKQIPVMKFDFTGLYVPPADVAQINPDYLRFGTPQVANTGNTEGFSLLGFSTFMESMSININNDTPHNMLIGKESIELADRKPEGTLVFEAPRIAEKDFFKAAIDQESGVMELKHGNKSGLKVTVRAPKVLLGNPSYQENNGVQMMSAPFIPAPVNGNDEIELVFE